MFDTSTLQRSHGRAHVGFAGGGIVDLAQAGSARTFVFPRRASGPEVVFLNTSGGLTSGDRLDLSLDLGPAQAMRATTQTAERAYRAESGPARVTVRFTLNRGAALDWLPQETILFQGAALDRLTHVTMAADASYLAIEVVVLGRAAMGETVTQLALTDRREVWRDGRLVLCDPLRLDADSLMRGSPALHGGARVLASLMCLAPGAADALPALRAALTGQGVEAAASARDGQVVVRLRAADIWAMRGQIARLVGVLRPGPLPRVWQHEGAAA
ncbi:urease accessory protein UreD [Gemmobacter denitrificans]|uniref:Urease accessory protein UreD n=1 Tax=Gemmobacter denitrificans TaxID=3123040 RepID=A0ABU8BXI6_9RHOB